MTKQSKDLKQSQVTVPFGATPATDPTHTSPSLVSTAWCRPTLGSFKPLNPTKWRAVCGKTARTVRREGESVPDSPYLDQTASLTV